VKFFWKDIGTQSSRDFWTEWYQHINFKITNCFFLSLMFTKKKKILAQCHIIWTTTVVMILNRLGVLRLVLTKYKNYTFDFEREGYRHVRFMHLRWSSLLLLLLFFLFPHLLSSSSSNLIMLLWRCFPQYWAWFVSSSPTFNLLVLKPFDHHPKKEARQQK